MTVIELTELNTINILDNAHFSSDQLHCLPFDRFNIQFPCTVFFTVDSIYNSTLENLRLNDSLHAKHSFNALSKMAKDIAEKYCTTMINLFVENKSNRIVFTLTDAHQQQLLKFKLIKDLPVFPIVEGNSFTKDPMLVSIKLITLVNKTVEFFNSPTIVKSRNVEKQMKPASVNRNVANHKKNYLYKTVYRYENLQTHFRAYNRTTESWGVRGHWRTYSNGNKIWIDSYIKGSGPDIKQDKVYKITQAL